MDKPKGKPRGKPFQKGAAPGPGRPEGSRNGSAFCKEWADTFGFEFLGRVASGTEIFIESRTNDKGETKVTKRSPYGTERLATAQYMIDRAYGKATQSHSVDPEAMATLGRILGATRRPRPTA